jgi:hypothetical protein
MTNKKIWLGMLVMVLVFGMTVVGCEEEDEDSGDTNYFDTFNFSNSSPTSAALSAGGLTQVQFNQIRDAAGGGFLGWSLDGGSDLMMAWSGRSVSNFTNVANSLKTMFTEEEREQDGDGGYASGGNNATNYFLSFFSVRTSGDGMFLPSGSMYASFYKN